MNCRKAREILTGRLEEIASGKLPRELETHLSACPSCASERLALEKMASELRVLADRQAPEGFSAGVMARVSADSAPARPSWRAAIFRWAAVPTTALAALALWMGTHAPAPSPTVASDHKDRACMQAYAQYRSQQALGGPSEMMAIASASGEAIDN